MVKVIKPEESEEYSPPRHYDIFNRQIVGRAMGAEKMSVALGRISPGGWAEIHTHDSSEHCHYILQGEVVVTMPNGSIKVTAGQAVWTGVREPHGMRNETNQDALYLVISAPLSP
ncbi:MAG: cupin domain-containing protein [Chloroflexi bacterium]|nr:cupin domain-containing protein [Chloroflexota bacterium]